MRYSRLRVVELYAGTGRSSDAFRNWPKCEISLLLDNNRIAANTYHANFPKTPYLVRDLTSIRADQISILAGGQIDLLVGCPPCQGFSDTGARNPDDPRNSHLVRFGHIAESLKPLAVVMENVPLATESNQFKNFLERMDRAGYNWTAGILNAALFGSSQCRQRLVYIGVRKNAGDGPEIPLPSHGGQKQYFSYRFAKMTTLDSDRVAMLGEAPATARMRNLLPHIEDRLGSLVIPTVGETLSGLPKVGSLAADRLCHRQWAHTPRQLRRMNNVPEGGRWEGGRDHFSQSYGRLHRFGLARTITTFFSNPGSGRFWHPSENRALTLREAARIQGFPDSFTFLPPYSHAAMLVGNALDAHIARLTVQVVRNSLE